MWYIPGLDNIYPIYYTHFTYIYIYIYIYIYVNPWDRLRREKVRNMFPLCVSLCASWVFMLAKDIFSTSRASRKSWRATPQCTTWWPQVQRGMWDRLVISHLAVVQAMLNRWLQEYIVTLSTNWPPAAHIDQHRLPGHTQWGCRLLCHNNQWVIPFSLACEVQLDCPAPACCNRAAWLGNTSGLVDQASGCSFMQCEGKQNAGSVSLDLELLKPWLGVGIVQGHHAS